MNEFSISETLTSPVVETCDVLVCGGGPAGIAAAISAARSGARTTLLELHGSLGGVWTAGSLSWIIDYQNKAGIMSEIRERLTAEGGIPYIPAGSSSAAYDPETMKIVLETMAEEAGIHIRLHTRVVAANVNTQGRIEHVLTESKSGREAWSAKIFVDTTGDGDLAAQAGCQFEMGHPQSGEAQPMSLMALVSGLDPKAIRPFFEETGGDTKEAAKKRLYEHLLKHGCSPSYAAPTFFRIHDGLFALMANHEYGLSAIDAEHVTKASLQARKEIYSLIKTLRQSGTEWKDLQLVSTAAQIGIREGRRIKGHYHITVEDLVSGRKHTDSICTVTFCIDVHSTNPNSGKAFSDGDIVTLPYDIPLRAAIAADVDGLMMAGRCISGDFFAHASYRVTGNAVQMGENVGMVAAKAALLNRLPQELYKPNCETTDLTRATNLC